MTFPLPPNATIGLVGGGQLGRMSAMAAARLGYRCHILTREVDSPAAQVAHAVTISDYAEPGPLRAFAAAVDVISFEFEMRLDFIRKILRTPLALEHPHTSSPVGSTLLFRINPMARESRCHSPTFSTSCSRPAGVNE